jgi:hypothetical protein
VQSKSTVLDILGAVHADAAIGVRSGGDPAAAQPIR